MYRYIKCSSTDSWIDEDIIERADLHIVTNDTLFASNYVYHAIEMGEETIVHYASELHMVSWQHAIMRRDIMKETAQREGINFIGVELPELLSLAGAPALLEFLEDDLPKQMSAHGENTAFFGTFFNQRLPRPISINCNWIHRLHECKRGFNCSHALNLEQQKIALGYRERFGIIYLVLIIQAPLLGFLVLRTPPDIGSRHPKSA